MTSHDPLPAKIAASNCLSTMGRLRCDTMNQQPEPSRKGQYDEHSSLDPATSHPIISKSHGPHHVILQQPTPSHEGQYDECDAHNPHHVVSQQPGPSCNGHYNKHSLRDLAASHPIVSKSHGPCHVISQPPVPSHKEQYKEPSLRNLGSSHRVVSKSHAHSHTLLYPLSSNECATSKDADARRVQGDDELQSDDKFQSNDELQSDNELWGDNEWCKKTGVHGAPYHATSGSQHQNMQWAVAADRK
ncbi:hypothetical protein EWM64_g6501 [Hericium alpestre]|uniref:Uncharacterized protein n=1 Tax=Hericium alpestre TaxID=135208 RepID=A0A4Y9ZVG2_9AGAM|nr:hypothetical protein EWM64_g6501 [Hericium alpestre]